jgi:iron(III) transport system ATP-binding protein
MTERSRHPAVHLADIRKAYGDVVALEGVSLDLEPGTMLALLGPSGCGKTTCLRLIAGFERPDRGSIDIDGRRVASTTSMVPPERRRVGFVFQDLALFPHMSARQNIAYGIRHDPDRAVRTDELLELVGLSGDADRMPHELSGGMQQRVALARALAPEPDVLLLDEPFSSLDQAMRTQLRAEVRQILNQARQSAIFVTHDQAEALTIADRVAVMTRGQVLQVAAPEAVYAEPATPYVATFIGVANLVSSDVRDAVAHVR